MSEIVSVVMHPQGPQSPGNPRHSGPVSTTQSMYTTVLGMAAQIQCDQGRSSVLKGLEFCQPAILGVPFLRMRIPSPSCGNVLNFLEGKYTVDC